MPAPSTTRRQAAYAARFGIAPTTAPVAVGYPILDEAAERRAAFEDLGRRLASPDRTPQDVLEALDWGADR